MAEQKVNQDPARDIYLWNFWKTPIMIRVRADKFVVTENYKKEIKEYFQKEGKSGSGGLKLDGGDVGGSLDGSGSTESESKEHEEIEIKQKIEAYLNQANFQVLNPNQNTKFTVESSSSINYISIIVDGVTEKNSWNVGDREVIVQASDSNPNKTFISSNTKPTLQDYFSTEKLFSISYLECIKTALSSFQDLYNFGKTVEVYGQRVLTSQTITNVAEAAMDFRGVNLSVAKLISAVSDIFFNQSLKSIYNYVYQTNLNKLDKDVVKGQLFKIGKQAKDIGIAFGAASGWYFRLASEVNAAHNQIIENETKSEEGLAGKIKKITNKKNDAYNNYCRVCDEMKWKIPVSWLSPIAGSAVTAKLVQERDGYWNDYERYRSELEDYTAKNEEAQKIFKRISNLADSVTKIGTFCSYMSSWFTQKSNAYSNFGKQKSQQSADISDKWKEWAYTDCISWAIALNSGYFKKYEGKIQSVFKEEDMTGLDLPDLGARFFKKEIGMEEHDSTLMLGEINLLVKSSDISYEGFKSNYEVDMKWIDDNKTDLDKMSNVLVTLNTSFAFLEEGVGPTSGWGTITLQSFGKDFVFSPEEQAKRLMKKQ